MGAGYGKIGMKHKKGAAETAGAGPAERNHFFLLGCALTVLAAFLLRVWQLGFDPLWYDESMYGYLARHLSREAMSGSFILPEPAFILLLKAWLVPGHGDAWMRFHAVLAGMAALYPAWLIGRRVAGRRGGLHCLLFLAPAPMLVYYSRDAKMYSWVILFVLAAVYLAMRCADSDAKPRHYALYVLCATLLCNMLFFAPLFLAPLNMLYMLFFARRLRQTMAWLFAQAAVILCSVPFILMELHYTKAMQGRVFHAPVPSAHSLWITLHNFLTAYSPNSTLHAAAAALAAVLALAGLLCLRGRRTALLFMLGVFAGSVAILFGLSHVLKWSLYIDRYVVGAVGPLLVVMALGSAALPWRPLRAVAVVAWVAVCAFGLHDLYAKHLSTIQHEHLGVFPTLDAKSIAKAVNEEGQPDDVVWHVFWETEAPVRWYLPERRHVLVDMGGLLQSNVDLICSRAYQEFHQWKTLELEKAGAGVSRVWYVMPDPGIGLDPLSRGVLDWLQAHGTLIARHESDPRYLAATLYLFDLQKSAGNKGRKTADLSLQGIYDPPGTGGSGQASISAETSADGTTITLAAKSGAAAPQTLPYEVLHAGAVCSPNRLERVLGEHSQWNIQRYLANGRMRPGMVFRVHKNADVKDLLACTTRCPEGEYGVYLEYTAKGAGYVIPTASIKVKVDEAEFEAPSSTAGPAGGWVWRYLGRVHCGQEKDLAIGVSARDPENRPEAYAVVGRLVFVHLTGLGATPPESPTLTMGAITIPPKGEASAKILFPPSAQCADILVQAPADVAELLITR